MGNCIKSLRKVKINYIDSNFIMKRERERERERSRDIKIKNIKKQNLLYGCFKKQSTQKISNQKMKLKERDKSILEYVQCMYNNVHAYKVPGF